MPPEQSRTYTSPPPYPDSFIPAPTSSTPEVSLKRLRGYFLQLEAALNSTDPIQKRPLFIDYLRKLSIYPFMATTHPSESGLPEFLDKLSSDLRFGTDISLMSQELLSRWESGDISPRRLIAQPNRPPTPPPNLYATEDSLWTTGSATKREMFRGMSYSYTEGGRRSLHISGEKKAADVFGHNGLAVGQWWPYQACAIRDGAHGAPIAGIYGNGALGAFSIVSAGGNGYEEVDDDRGNMLWYSGPNGDRAKGSKAAVVTPGTKALMQSYRKERKVRVIRKGTSEWAPDVGFRYDGLYQIKKAEEAKKANGEWFWRFKFIRCAGQEDLKSVCARSPTHLERKAYEEFQTQKAAMAD
ncbi:PUA-like domain-containing protein [Trichophaea hybrida]|nr:PUA-like domain-containing protein [Trichophaea hybrida]